MHSHNWKHVGENGGYSSFLLLQPEQPLPNALAVGGGDWGWGMEILSVGRSLTIGLGSKHILLLCGKPNVRAHPSWALPWCQEVIFSSSVLCDNISIKWSK